MLASDILGNAVNLEEDAARTHLKNIVFRVAFPAPHPHLSRLRGYRTVGENANPELPGLRGRAGKHLTHRFNLVARYART